MVHEGQHSSQEMLVKQHFEKSAEQWQSMYSRADLQSRSTQQRLAHVLRYADSLGLKRGARALDLGCGAGLASAELLRRGFYVTGVDVAESMLALARKNCGEVESSGKADFVVGSAEELDFESNTFDIIIALGLIEYLRWGRSALQEIHRLLNPGGHLIVTVPNRRGVSFLADPIFWAYKIGSKLKGAIKKTASKPNKSFSRTLYTPSEIKLILESVGFQVLHYVTHGFGPFRLLKHSNTITLKIDSLLRTCAEKGLLPFLRGLGDDCVLLCKKLPIPKELGRRPIFVDIDKLALHIKVREKKLFKRHEAWLREYPEYLQQGLAEYLPEKEDAGSVLVLSPHPDDEIIGCGGTLIRFSDLGLPVTIAQLTDGGGTVALNEANESLRRTVRLEEARQVARRLGAEVICWDEHDGKLACSPQTVSRLVELLNRMDPRTIFVPFLNDCHPDHIAANRILLEALKAVSLNMKSTRIVSYEVWSLVPANCYCIIDDQFDKKAELLMMYRTGMKAVDYPRFCESMAAYHAWTLLHKKGFIEAFLKLSAQAYIELASRVGMKGFNAKN